MPIVLNNYYCKCYKRYLIANSFAVEVKTVLVLIIIGMDYYYICIILIT